MSNADDGERPSLLSASRLSYRAMLYSRNGPPPRSLTLMVILEPV